MVLLEMRLSALNTEAPIPPNLPFDSLWFAVSFGQQEIHSKNWRREQNATIAANHDKHESKPREAKHVHSSSAQCIYNSTVAIRERYSWLAILLYFYGPARPCPIPPRRLSDTTHAPQSSPAATPSRRERIYAQCVAAYVSYPERLYEPWEAPASE